MDTFNWRTTFLIIGILIVVVMVIAAQFFKREPGNSELNPYGEFVNNDQNVINQGPSFQWSIRTYQFWSIFFAIFCFTFTSFSVLIYLVPKAILAGISPVVAATILASVGILQVVGRIFSGLVADRIGNKRVFVVGFIITIAILMLIITNSTLWVFYVFAIIYGLVQGSISTSQPSLVASLFGSKNLGLILGGISFGFTLGAAVGPYTVGYLFDNTGNYNTGLMVCAGISIVGLLLILSLKPFNNTSGISKP
jgi:predicted MFS family arabinose efflux permease